MQGTTIQNSLFRFSIKVFLDARHLNKYSATYRSVKAGAVHEG